MPVLAGMMFADMISRTPISTPLNEWLIAALAHSGLSQAALADRLSARVQRNIDRSIINKMTLGKRVMSAEELLLISEITGFDLPSDKQDLPAIAVAGKVGAGAKVDLIDAYTKGDGLYHVACPPQIRPHGIVAVEVEGTSMAPTYEPGAVLFYSRETIGIPTEAIGRICVCEDEAGRAWVKQVKVGTEEGTFSLISLNPEAENMHGVRLKWAAPVRLSLPPEFVKRVE